MKFHNLSIRNLRAIRQFEVTDLGSLVVIAGANGCGKSCAFDAIRLLKSMYGGYSANEYHQWMGEFSVNLQDTSSLGKLFRDPRQPIEIIAEISFAEREVSYLRENAEGVVQAIAWQEITGQPVDYWTFNRMAVAIQLRQYQVELIAATSRLAEEVRAALINPIHRLALTIMPSGEIRIEECKPAEAAFQAYEPDELGVIEYHSASRAYTRQDVGGINLDTRAFEDQRRQHGLYNAQAKYQNVKTELASSYLRRIIAREAGAPDESGEDLNSTLIELFQTFFPDKSYEGVRPQARGSLTFPVRLSTGEVHDIDEMSSGEKEILYGYLKLKNSTPGMSVILLDEPELHLNPSLLQGFADFYYRHLGVAAGNQLWMVTHSDALLRQAVGNPNYKVFHMVPASAAGVDENQAVEVLRDDDVDRVAMDLVGDLAIYSPRGKVVVLEGRPSSSDESEDGFDAMMVRRLFPDFAKRTNIVSGGNKRRVRDLYALLRESSVQSATRNRFFAITDRDFESHDSIGASGVSELTWDRYHIENYLLHPASIRAVFVALTGVDPFGTDESVLTALRSCAETLLHRLVLERMQDEVNSTLMASIKIGASPETTSPAVDLAPSIAGSVEHVQRAAATFDKDALVRREESIRSELVSALADSRWISSFPGRPILRRFANVHLGGSIDGRMLSMAILDKMAESGVQPEGMKAVLDSIVSA